MKDGGADTALPCSSFTAHCSCWQANHHCPLSLISPHLKTLAHAGQQMVGQTHTANGWSNTHSEWLVRHTQQTAGQTHTANDWSDTHSKQLDRHTQQMAGQTHIASGWSVVSLTAQRLTSYIMPLLRVRACFTNKDFICIGICNFTMREYLLEVQLPR